MSLRGVTLAGVPTSHRRIPVIEDAELAAALDGARARLGPDRSKASLLRDLALRGWRELSDEQDLQRRAADELDAILDEGLLDLGAALAARRRDPAGR